MMIPSKPVTPTAADIDQAKATIAAHIRSIETHPDSRQGAYPYYLFHQPGQPILGTVMVFHGFSAKPHQMWRLADYLFQNGFNVYQCNLAGHALTHPAVNWPQIDLKPEYADPLKAKAKEDPIIRNFIQNFSETQASPGFLQQAALVRRLFFIEPRIFDIVKAVQRPDDPDFDRYYTSSHMDYLTYARDRLSELGSMPGPIYTVGLSVGGAVALGLAADQPNRIEGVVAYAPMLETYGEDRR
ncbi:alpha/beta hydrolase, partial [filamentous cyanobacterium CCP5]